MLGGEGDGLGLDVGVVARAFEGMRGVEFGFAAEPRGLALGVVAMALLCVRDGFGFSEFAPQDGAGFGVAERLKGSACGAEPLDETAGFFDQATSEHPGCAGVDAAVELGALGREGEAEDAVAGEGVAAGLPLFGDGPARSERDLDGADGLGNVVGVYAGGGRGVEPEQGVVEVFGAPGGGAPAQEFAQGGVLRGRGEESVEQRAGVEAGATGEDGQGVAFGELGENGAGVAGVVAGGAGLGGVVKVEQVVRDEEALRGRRLGGADLHVAVDGDGVAGEDFALEMPRESKRESGFAGGGGAEEGDEWAHWLFLG